MIVYLFLYEENIRELRIRLKPNIHVDMFVLVIMLLYHRVIYNGLFIMMLMMLIYKFYVGISDELIKMKDTLIDIGLIVE